MGKAPKVTEKMRKFAAGVARHGNAAKAAREAGYSARTARMRAHALMKDPRIQEMIEREKVVAEARRRGDGVYDEDRIRKEIAYLAFSRITDFCQFDDDLVRLLASDDLPEHVVAAIAEISQTHNQFGTNTKVKLHPKLPALQLAAQEMGMLIERHEITEKKAKVYAQLVIKMLSEEIKDPELLERVASKLEDLEDE